MRHKSTIDIMIDSWFYLSADRRRAQQSQDEEVTSYGITLGFKVKDKTLAGAGV